MFNPGDFHGAYFRLMSYLDFWLIIPLVIVTALIPDFAGRAFINSWPDFQRMWRRMKKVGRWKQVIGQNLQGCLYECLGLWLSVFWCFCRFMLHLPLVVLSSKIPVSLSVNLLMSLLCLCDLDLSPAQTCARDLLLGSHV